MSIPFITRFVLVLTLPLTLVLTGKAQNRYTLEAQTVDASTGEPLPYVSLGIKGKPFGTVSDAEGNFRLTLSDSLDNDSIRVALLGYAPITASYGEFRRRTAASGARVGLKPAPVAMKEVTIKPKKFKQRVIGNSTNSTFIQANFKINELGNQIGLRVRLRRQSLIEQVTFRVAQCTYDSLFYRVNVYQINGDEVGANLLPEPVYVWVRKGQIKDRIVADLRKYDLFARGDVLLALEMVKDLGPGRLTLATRLGGGPIYFTAQEAGGWDKFPGFGVGIDATVTEYWD